MAMRISKNRIDMDDNVLQKSVLKETCAAAAKRRRRNGKRKGFQAECLVFFAREFLKVFFGEISWKSLKNHTGFFQIGTELKICVMHIVFIGTSSLFSHGLGSGLPSEFDSWNRCHFLRKSSGFL